MLRSLILGASGVAIGMATFFSFGYLKAIFTTRKMSAFYALAWGGFAGALFIITKAVFRAPAIPLTGDAVGYGVSLVAAGIGCLGIGFDQRSHHRRSEDP